jgi:hypothetical protein
VQGSPELDVVQGAVSFRQCEGAGLPCTLRGTWRHAVDFQRVSR